MAQQQVSQACSFDRQEVVVASGAEALAAADSAVEAGLAEAEPAEAGRRIHAQDTKNRQGTNLTMPTMPDRNEKAQKR